MQARLAQHEVELIALEGTALRLLCEGWQGLSAPIQASMLKVCGTELRQAIFETLFDIAGPLALPFDEQALLGDDLDRHAAAADTDTVAVAANLLDSRKLSLYGGSNEVQRNLIGASLLAD